MGRSRSVVVGFAGLALFGACGGGGSDGSPTGKGIITTITLGERATLAAGGGSGLTSLTNHPGDDYDPDWSPDGTRLAFASDRDGNYEVYVVGAHG